nr:5566_t:CDS:2 [Entrophospora candida]
MVESAYPVQSKLQGMISLEDVYNCDETGLLCELELSKTQPTGLISCVKSKKRVTLLLLINPTGTKKKVKVLDFSSTNLVPMEFIELSVNQRLDYDDENNIPRIIIILTGELDSSLVVIAQDVIQC